MGNLTRYFKKLVAVLCVGTGLFSAASAHAYYFLNPFTKQLDFYNFNGSGTASQVTFFSGTNTLRGDTGFTYNSSTNTLTVDNLFVTSCTGCGGGGGGSDGNWVYSSSGGFIRPTTTTNDVLIGGTNTSTADFIFDVSGSGQSVARLPSVSVTGTDSAGVYGGFATKAYQESPDGSYWNYVFANKAAVDLGKMGMAFYMSDDGSMIFDAISTTGTDFFDMLSIVPPIPTIGTGFLVLGGGATSTEIYPGLDAKNNLGDYLFRFKDLWLSGGVNASGTGKFGTNVTVAGVSVCLQNGTNCPASGGGTVTSSTWQFNQTRQTIFPTTSTFDVLIGGSTTATSQILFDVPDGSMTASGTLMINGAGTSTFFGPVSSTRYMADFGSVSQPSYGFKGGFGMYMNGPTQVAFSALGSGKVFLDNGDFTTANQFRPLLNGTIDNGLPTAMWRNGYWAGQISSTGFLSLNATSTNATTTNFFVGTTARLPTDSLINGTAVCLSNGTNCPAGLSAPTLSQVTAQGNSATATLQLFGGFLASSSTVTSTFTVVGDTTLQSTLGVTGLATFGTATATLVNANSAAIGTLTGGSGAFNVLTVGGQNVCLANGTNCPASGGGSITSSTWQFNQTSGIMYPTTSTFDVLVGGSVTDTAGFIYDFSSPTSSLSIGSASGNANFFVGTSTYTSTNGKNLSQLFAMNGNDAYFNDMIGVASSVYVGQGAVVSSTSFMASNQGVLGRVGYALGAANTGINLINANQISVVIGGISFMTVISGNSVTFGVPPTPSNNNGSSLGTTSVSWGNVFTSSTVFVGGNLLQTNPASSNFTIGSPTGSWGNIFSSSTIRSLNYYSGDGAVAGTSTVRVGKSGVRGCLAMGDSDGSGVTYCTANNGSMNCGLTTCE